MPPTTYREPNSGSKTKPCSNEIDMTQSFMLSVRCRFNNQRKAIVKKLCKMGFIDHMCSLRLARIRLAHRPLQSLAPGQQIRHRVPWHLPYVQRSRRPLGSCLGVKRPPGRAHNSAGLANNSIYFSLLLWKLIDLPWGQISDPLTGRYCILFHSSQQLPCLSLRPLKGFLSWHATHHCPSTSHRTLFTELQRNRDMVRWCHSTRTREDTI